MKYAIVYSSVTGNTEKLAEKIKGKIGDCYFGSPADEALDADTIFVGFWAIGNSCGADIKAFIEKLADKKIFIFGTAGYNNTEEYFKGILDSVKAAVPESSTLIGSYMCQGAVSYAQQEKIKEKKPEKYEEIKDNLAESEKHPDDADLQGLISAIDKVI